LTDRRNQSSPRGGGAAVNSSVIATRSASSARSRSGDDEPSATLDLAPGDLCLGEPAVRIALGWLILGEAITGITVAGAAVVVLVVAVVVWVEPRRPRASV